MKNTDRRLSKVEEIGPSDQKPSLTPTKLNKSKPLNLSDFQLKKRFLGLVRLNTSYSGHSVLRFLGENV